jgi:tetratricopeptide (TPR) repeat protein
MTTTAAGGVFGLRPPARSRVSGPRWSTTLVVWLACAVVVGASVGRVVFFTPTSSGSGADTSARVVSPTAAPSAAVTALEARVDDVPTDVRALQALGVAYIRKATQVADPAFYDLAQRAFDRADAVTPDLDDTNLGRGLLALSRHDFGGALDLGLRVHARNPDNPDALAVTVDAQVELGHYDDAAATLQELFDRHPGLPAYARLSYIRELHGDSVGARRAMRAAETAANGIAFDRATVAALLGDLELGRGNFRAAHAAYEKALRLEPQLVLAEIGQARVDVARGRRADAIARLRRLVRRLPVTSAVALLGDLQEQAGQRIAATRSFDLVRTVGTLQQSAGQVTDLEMAIFEADHADDTASAARAVELARRAYDARPDNVFVNDALGWSLYRAGDVAGALPYVDRALRLGTPDALLHFHAAVVFDAAGETDRARAEIGTVLAGNPWFSARYHDQALALAQQLGVK